MEGSIQIRMEKINPNVQGTLFFYARYTLIQVIFYKFQIQDKRELWYNTIQCLLGKELFQNLRQFMFSTAQCS